MLDIVNLSRNIKKQLPTETIKLLKTTGQIAHKRQQRSYLVGGMVRDLLLERENLDLDIVVEGDAIKLAREITAEKQADITEHKRFGTAKIRWNGREIDFVTARAETYARPGALPTVRPGTIHDDLARRDFTINAMAVELSPRRFGELIDPHDGRHDIENSLIRVLHERSFIDDATRIWRAIRYEQRLDFHLELATQELLKQSTAWLRTISGDRIRHELDLVLREEQPEKTLFRADELGALTEIHAALKGDIWLMETFALAYEHALPDPPSPPLYLALLAYRLNAAQIEQLISYLRLPKTTAKILRDTIGIKTKIEELTMQGPPPSHIYRLLHGYSTTALTANLLATDDEATEEHIELYLNVLRYIRPSLKGEDIKKLGVKSGPKISEAIDMLQEAKLDGKVSTRREEEEMVRKMFAKS
jgi:tRNA nucleotidyltransferase (CCA-adding enzyme)